jgi:hypothetical protein
MPREISSATRLDTLRKEAKRWLRQLRDGDAQARERVSNVYPDAQPEPGLRDVQHALAREYGYESWIALKRVVGERGEDLQSAPLLTMEAYEALAEDFVGAFDKRDDAALARLNAHYQRSFTFDDLWAEVWRRVYAFRQRSSKVPQNYLGPDEARVVLAQDTGFGSWEALAAAVRTGGARVPAYAIDSKENRIAPRRRLSGDEWDDLFAVMKERRITALDAGGLMTDEAMARIATLDQVTSLSLGGSRSLTDDGLRHLARMPQLEQLDLSEYPGGRLTDRGLAVLRDLPNLRKFGMAWQRGITDEGVGNLRFCDRLEEVGLMGSPTGDGAIRALAGKPNLRVFNTGALVTDEGLPLLHEFPRFKTWRGGHPPSKDDADVAGRLLIDGPFTDRGLASLAGLEGVADLDIFWHARAMTSDGFAALAGLPNLLSLGADGKLSDDIAMRHFAAIPRLFKLRAQEAVASEEGFIALARSKSLGGFWGRVCPNFGSRAFLAFSRMPSLQRLGVGLANVHDEALAAFPSFPSLRELTPIGVQDPGFRHIGRCHRLERLTCMYCRDTTDQATEHIANLKIRYYYAGLTRITDHSLEILARMPSLEEIEFYECKGITDAGLRFLVRLPNLKALSVGESPGVTLTGTKVFPSQVRVQYTT